MKKDKALKLALEALKEAHYKSEYKQDATKREQAITAIKEALAQSSDSIEQEPVGLDKDTLQDMAASAFETAMAFGISTDSFERLARDVNKRVLAALAHSSNSVEQEPTTDTEFINRGCHYQTELTQTKRQPLTDEQIEDIGFNRLPTISQKDFVEFARVIEAAHDIKETT